MVIEKIWGDDWEMELVSFFNAFVIRKQITSAEFHTFLCQVVAGGLSIEADEEDFRMFASYMYELALDLNKTKKDLMR